jgi:hypothetical protein
MPASPLSHHRRAGSLDFRHLAISTGSPLRSKYQDF